MLETLERLNDVAWMAGATVLLSMFAAVCAFTALRYIARKAKGREGSAAVFALFAIVATIYGGGKFYFESGMRDNGSYATNDTVVVRWQKDGTLPIPNSSTVYIDYRLHSSTNAEDWVWLGSATIGDSEATFALADATNYVYSIYYDYVPPTPVQTNGVWRYETSGGRAPQRTDELFVSPVGARATGDGEPITPKMTGEK